MSNPPYHVVVIEDNESEIYLLEEAMKLASVPVEIIPFTEAEKAVDYFSHATKQPIDLIIVDLNMPTISGAELVISLRGCASASDVPMVISSTTRSGALPASVHGKLPAPYFSKQSSWHGYLHLARAVYSTLLAKTWGASPEHVANTLVARMKSTRENE